MNIGFIGLGNVGGKLAGSLLRHGHALNVLDLDEAKVDEFVAAGATAGRNPAAMADANDILITCLPSPAATAVVLEGEHGALEGFSSGKIWVEMSTTDVHEVQRLAALVEARGARAADCPVSGGCHRAATGNIAIFAGCEREVFERLLPILTTIGRRVLHTGELGTASSLKVMSNYLATANLVSVCEALATAGADGLDLATTYEALRISSGNSFVLETEGQLILNGSRNVEFTIGLVQKDIGLFQQVAERAGVPLEINPLLMQIMQDGAERYGAGEWSPNIIRRLEEAVGKPILADGFPDVLVDDEPEASGHEVLVQGR